VSGVGPGVADLKDRVRAGLARLTRILPASSVDRADASRYSMTEPLSAARQFFFVGDGDFQSESGDPTVVYSPLNCTRTVTAADEDRFGVTELMVSPRGHSN